MSLRPIGPKKQKLPVPRLLPIEILSWSSLVAAGASGFTANIAVLKSTNDPLDGFAGWTTARAGSASYYNQARVRKLAGSGISRCGSQGAAHYLDAFDGQRAHWLLEPVRTNSALDASDLTQATWLKQGTATPCTISANGRIGANDGNQTMDGIVCANGTFTNVGVTNAAAYTWTASTRQCGAFEAAPGNKSFVAVVILDKDGLVTATWFNVSTGAVGTKGARHTVKMWPLANGTFRCEWSLDTSGTGATAPLVAYYWCDADAVLSLTGDGATVNGWMEAIQHEQDAPWVTSFIATGASPVARVTDSIPTRLHNSTPQARTLFVDFTEIGSIFTFNGGPILEIGAGTSLLAAYRHNTAGYGMIANNGGGQIFIDAPNMGVALPPPSIGDHVELRVVEDPTPQGIAAASINGVVETSTGPAGAPGAYIGAYGATTYSVGLAYPYAIRALKDALGVRSQADMRAA